MARASPPLNGRGRRGARSVAFVMMEIRYSLAACDVKRLIRLVIGSASSVSAWLKTRNDLQVNAVSLMLLGIRKFVNESV
jgi:hypothetical protein